MLRTAEITAELTGLENTRHQLYWRSRLEFTLDCFICERTGRTTVFERGAEQAQCSGSRSGFQSHRTAGRIAGFDTTTGRDRLAVRALADFWWAPFTDTRDDRKAAAPAATPGFGCTSPITARRRRSRGPAASRPTWCGRTT